MTFEPKGAANQQVEVATGAIRFNEQAKLSETGNARVESTPAIKKIKSIKEQLPTKQELKLTRTLHYQYRTIRWKSRTRNQRRKYK